MIIDYPWYHVLFCLLAGAVYAGVLYYVGRRRFGKGVNALLASLRFVAVSIIALLLLAPVSRHTVNERQQPRVVLLADASLSVRQSADSTFSLLELADDLKNNLNITYETFGSPNATDIGEALMRHRYDDVAAMVLATDGIYNHGGNPATLAEQLGCPVYAVALGDTTLRRDAALADLRVSRIAMQNSNFPLELTINAALLKGINATITVNNAQGQQLYTQRLNYDSDDYSTTLSTALPADKPGLQRYTVILSVAAGEITAENNVMTFYVDIIDTRRHVAIFANAPHPDLAALKHAIESNPAYKATIVMADEAQSGRFRAQDSNFSLAILHNLPSRTHTDIGYAKDLPQMFIIGTQTDLSRFNALHSGLEITAKANRNDEVTALYQSQFSLFHLDDAEAIEAMPPLTAPFGVAHMSAGVQTLFTSRIGPVDSRQPLVAATAQGEVRRAFIWGEGLWRWRLADYQTNSSHEHFDRMTTQLVAFTAMQQQRQRLQVETERSYGVGETPVIRAQLYNESYELTNTPEVTMKLHGDSLDAEYRFMRDGATYRMTLPDLPQGLYHYTATADDISTDGSFAIEAINLEQCRLVADHNLLRTISATTGGEMYYPDQLSALSSQLSTLKPTIYTHTRYAEFLRLPLVLALILLLLATEWVLRKYNGTI